MLPPGSVLRQKNYSCLVSSIAASTSHRAHHALPRLIFTTRLPVRQPQHWISSSTGVPYKQPFMSTPRRSASPSASEPSEEEDDYSEPSPETNIRDCEYKKWGFVIYRTTYDDASNKPWAAFKDRILSNLRKSILESDAPEILNNMDIIFVDDPALEGASVGDLQHRFRAWVQEENMVPFEMPGGNGNERVYVPRGARHEFFIMVDDVGLHAPYASLVRGFPEDPDKEGRVHLKVWHHAIGTELYDELGDPNAAWTGRYYRFLPRHLVAQSY